MSVTLHSHSWANALIFAGASEPSSTRSALSISSVSSSSRSSVAGHPVRSLPRQSQSPHELANVQTCRFIRSTLALNGIPFVNSHTSAEALWEHIVFLNGEQAGIDMYGESAVSSLATRRGIGMSQASWGIKHSATRSSAESSHSAHTRSSTSPEKKKVAFDLDVRENAASGKERLKDQEIRPESATIAVDPPLAARAYPSSPITRPSTSSLSAHRASHPSPCIST